MLDADEAISVGSVDQPDGNPFLNIDLLVGLARDSHADAVHPGYGYLSENAQFADAVRAAGIIYIGPPSAAINTLGDKREAKEYLAKHEPSVPLIPGFTGSSNGVSADDLHRESDKIGFPVMIKAAAGGGGKGLRIVRESSSLAGEFERAQSEAQRSFGRGDCILEKYIEAGKHVEVQIMGDSHGNVLSLWERDCSVQRRHQKIIEESPCRWLTQEKREAMCSVAVRIGQLLHYEGAGTVEFIVDISTGLFYFLEVNARLQVEHPITEECTGLDLVALQLFVASLGDMSSVPKLKRIPQNGHAIECRLCAEAPSRQFAPQHGRVRLWAPSTVDGATNTRFETAIETGAMVGIHFDPMIAKIVVWAPNRAMAVDKMAKVLSQTVCIGPGTNQLFLQSCLLHPAFVEPNYTTAFIATHMDRLLENPYLASSIWKKHHHEPLLSVIPGLYIREIGRPRQQQRDCRTVFASVQRGFRNQRFDRINLPVDIISAPSFKSSEDKMDTVCLWTLPTESSSSNATVRLVVADPVPQVGGNTDASSTKATATHAYHVLSKLVRSGSLARSKPYSVMVHEYTTLPSPPNDDGASEICMIHASIDNIKLQGYLVVDRPTASSQRDVGQGLRILCHFPALGCPREFTCHSPLSFAESMRQAAADTDGESGSTILAPMPCKVLRVLKKDGDEVKKGEVLLIIESMKMEITVTSGRDGRFSGNTRQGEAVSEGSTLCHVK